MTLKTVARRMQSDPLHWQVYLMNFVDEFRRTRDVRMIEEPVRCRDERLRALLAGTVEYLCGELKLATPAWVRRVPACRTAWFVAGVENLKATALVESPLPFRLRKIFVLENFLSRV